MTKPSSLLPESTVLTLLFPACQAGTDFAYYSADLKVSILGVVSLCGDCRDIPTDQES